MSLELPSLDFQPKFFSGGPSRFHLPFLYDVIASHRPQRVVLLGFGGEELHFAICQAVRERADYSLPNDSTVEGRRKS